ncbi:Death-inducer obliterator 1, partial [Stegodyphus mimosarum]
MDQEPTSTVSIGSPETNPKSSSKEIPSKPATSVWKGFISMQDVAKFVTSAYKVSGQTDHLHVDIPDTIQVCGRIIPDQVWDYLSKIKQSGNKELIIIRFQAANEEEAVTYNSFYSYLSSRKRYGVVSNYSKKIKDFYILPLAATSPVPIVLMPFDGPGLPTPRPHLLLGVIVRHKIRQVSPTRISKQNVSEGDQKVVDGSYTPPLETRSYTPPLPASVDNEGDIVCDSFYSPTADLNIIVSNKESDLTRSASSGTRKLKRKSENPYEPSYIPPVKKLPDAEISPSDKDDDKPYDPEQEVLNITSGRQEHKLSPSENSEKFDNLEKHKKILDALTRQVEETDRQVNVLKQLISLPDSTDVDEDSPSGQTLDISSVAGTGMSSFLDLPENLQDILNVVRLKSYDKDCVPFENRDIDMRVGHLFQKNSNSVPEKEAHHPMLKVSNVNNCDKSADTGEKCSSQGATPPPDEDDDYSVMRPSDPRIKLRTSFQDSSFPNDEPVNVSLSSMSVSELVEKAQKQLAEMEAVEHVQATKQITSDCPNDSASKNPDDKLPSANWSKFKEPPPPGIELAEMRPQDNLYSTKTVPSLVPNNSVTSSYESTLLVHETQRVAPEFPPPPISSFPPPHLPPRFPVQTPPPNLKSFPPPNVVSTAFPPPPLTINPLPPKGADNNTGDKPWPPWQISGQQSDKNDWNSRVPNWEGSWENQQGRHNVDYSDSNSQYYQPERSGNYQKEQFYKNDFSSDNQWERSQRFDRGRWFRHPVRGRRWENQRQRRAFSYGRQHRN